MGVRIDCEAEVCEAGPVDGLHLYWGWHHFVGSILEKGEPLTLGEDFDVAFRQERHCAWPVFDAKTDLVQIDFSTRLPWALAEDPPPIFTDPG